MQVGQDVTLQSKWLVNGIQSVPPLPTAIAEIVQDAVINLTFSGQEGRSVKVGGSLVYMQMEMHLHLSGNSGKQILDALVHQLLCDSKPLERPGRTLD